jgi:hypothetical protein
MISEQAADEEVGSTTSEGGDDIMATPPGWFAMTPERRRRVAIGAVSLVVATALIVAVTRGGSSDDPEGEAAAPAGAPVRITEGATGADKTSGRGWRAIKGEWTLRDDEIRIGKEGKLLFSLLVTDGGSSNTVTSVRMPVVTTGSGVVFRYSNPFNYWMLRAARNVASWQVVKVIDGRTTIVGNTGFSPTSDGTLVGVASHDDGRIIISFNGKFQSSFAEPELADKRGVGVGAVGLGSSRAVFSGFTVTPQSAPSAPAPAPAQQPGDD